MKVSHICSVEGEGTVGGLGTGGGGGALGPNYA